MQNKMDAHTERALLIKQKTHEIREGLKEELSALEATARHMRELFERMEGWAADYHHDLESLRDEAARIRYDASQAVRSLVLAREMKTRKKIRKARKGG